MAANITLSYFGPPEQKHVVKVPPMQTLLQALEAAASKFKPALVPAHCSLQYNKKPVDLNTPFRLLNVPAGSKLEVLIYRPKQEQAPAASAAPAPQQQQQQQQQVTDVQQQRPAAPTAAGAAPSQAAAPCAQPAAAQAPAVHFAQDVQQQQRQQQQVATPAVATPAALAASVLSAHSQAGPAAAAGPSSSAAQAGPCSSAAAAAADAPGPLAALGVQGQVYVFNQRTLEAAAQGPKPMELDPPDDFFELTTEDLVRLQQEANRKKQADTLFKPRAMRDAEQAALASSLGPIRVRLHFPDATIIQASFAASQPLSAVLQLVTQIALESAAPALYLYTTPPKTVLKDMTATLYQLGLVPAAHLYVGCEPKKLKASVATSITGVTYPGPYLKPEVLALMQDLVPGQHTDDSQQQQQQEPAEQQREAAVTAADAQRALALAAAAGRAEAGGGSRAAAGGGGAKVPKWLKMGK